MLRHQALRGREGLNQEPFTTKITKHAKDTKGITIGADRRSAPNPPRFSSCSS